MVKLLLEKGYAYQTEQAIYFDVTKLADYGKLTGQRLSDKEVAARREVVTDPDKDHPYDFSVWFFAVGRFKDHSMKWPSPWGEGFPGWHLECSAIIHTILGDPIDIHTGGVDHIGTHHTNELAQTEAAFGHELARVWMHNEFILVDGAKMAKSKRNFYTLRDIVDRKFAPLAFRLLILQAHYRSEINFTLDSMTAAQNTLLNLYAWADLRFQTDTHAPANQNLLNELAAIKEPLADDLDTPSALAHLFRLIDASWSELSPSDYDIVLPTLDKWFGLGLDHRFDLTKEQTHLIAQREAARAKKNWAHSDELRDELTKSHLELNDTSAGTRWRRNVIS
jgi:cysteinyl-tRNA synthetase